MGEQVQQGHAVSFRTWASIRQLRSADEIWIHCGWLPCLWWAALWGRNVRWMPEACYDPIRRAYHGWKKTLVGPIERFCLRRAKVLVATCEAEADWIRAYLGRRCPPVEVTDIKRFFNLANLNPVNPVNPVKKDLHLLYLGRRHPLKGLNYLEAAVQQLSSVPSSLLPVTPQLKVVSNAFGEELEKIWDWCDVLVLPTLSDNFGLVIAEALERGRRVITTDGAPAWGEVLTGLTGFTGLYSGYGGRLIYLKGYRDGTDEERVELLKKAIERICK
ncbi:MAG: hypothetical protein IJ173_00175 [Kiritimatiellae bacterium]|nr:hypothetical protein [Kiritimatiellia bacterium]